MGVVVLDRDGVINRDRDDYVRSAAQWEPLPGSLEAIARLAAAGYRVAVATNQSGLARGLFDADALAGIHREMRARVRAAGGRIDALAFCPHAPDAGCGCRKPATGLLADIERALGRPLAGACLVGDGPGDLQAAAAFGMRPVLVRTGKGGETERRLAALGLAGVPVYADLLAAVRGHVLA